MRSGARTADDKPVFCFLRWRYFSSGAVGFSEETAALDGQGMKMQIVNLLKAFRLLRRTYPFLESALGSLRPAVPSADSDWLRIVVLVSVPIIVVNIVTIVALLIVG